MPASVSGSGATEVLETREEVMAPAGMVQWARARTLQPSEAWLTFQAWIERDNPRFAYSVARNIFTGSQIPETERQWAQWCGRRRAAACVICWCQVDLLSPDDAVPGAQARRGHSRSQAPSATGFSACALMAG
jgi:hypothetical protein